MKVVLEKIVAAIDPIFGKISDFFKSFDKSESLFGFIISIAVIAVLLLAFALTFIFIAKSKVKKFNNSLIDAEAFVRHQKFIDESNVNLLNDRINCMPISVQDGWSNFLSQEINYPSAYISSQTVLEDKSIKTKRKSGKTFFKFVSTIAILLGMGLAAIANWDIIKASVQESSVKADKIMLIIMGIVTAFFAPVIVYVVLKAIISACYGSQQKKLKTSFAQFQNALDDTVILHREEQDEFVTENIEEINSAIEEIIAKRLDKKEIIEIITTPFIEESDTVDVAIPATSTENDTVDFAYFDDSEERDPMEEVAPALAVDELRTEEEKIVYQQQRSILANLINVVESAIDAPEVDRGELEQIAEVIASAKINTFSDPFDQEVLDACLRKLAVIYFDDSI